MKIQALIFDLDGTLIDSIEDLADCMNTVLTRLGVAPHPLQKYREFVGDGLKKLVERCLAQSRPELFEQAVQHMRTEYAQNWMRKTRLYPGMAELLDEIKRRNLPMAVLSNKPHDMTRLVCAHFLQRWPIACAQGASDQFPHKPDPSSAMHIAVLLHCKPASMMFLGDTDVDMQTACAAGMVPVGVSWGFRPRSELLAHGARYIIDHPGELPALLEKLNRPEA